MTILCTAEKDMATSVAPSDIATFLTNAAWAIRSTYHTVLKASPDAAIFGRDMSFDIHYQLTGTRQETTGNAKLILTCNMKTIHAQIMITKWVEKYLYGKMVSSTKQKAGMTVNHGQSRQFIQMAQSDTKKYFSTLICCGWAHGCTLTLI